MGGHLEREIRQVPRVLAVSIVGERILVLVEPGADAAAIEREAMARRDAAGWAGAVEVLGGIHRRGRRAIRIPVSMPRRPAMIFAPVAAAMAMMVASLAGGVSVPPRDAPVPREAAREAPRTGQAVAPHARIGSAAGPATDPLFVRAGARRGGPVTALIASRVPGVSPPGVPSPPKAGVVADPTLQPHPRPKPDVNPSPDVNPNPDPAPIPDSAPIPDPPGPLPAALPPDDPAPAAQRTDPDRNDDHDDDDGDDPAGGKKGEAGDHGKQGKNPQSRGPAGPQSNR